MFITAVASYAYMWWTRVPDPFGTREVRWLLIARAVGGFFGVFGMYFSLLYMPLAEATVLTFLAPIVACYACSFLLPNEPFTRNQQWAALVSLFGVVLIARPFSGGKMEDGLDPGIFYNSTMTDSQMQAEDGIEAPSASQHLLAIGLSLIGVLGAACAYTTIRLIGSRAHALVSVTYFSTYTTIISTIAMLAIPSVSFRLPGSAAEWGLLLGLGVNGFTMQYLLTAGLAYQPTSNTKGHGTRATSMVYTQMLFALFYDKVVMDTSPSAISWAGSGLILGCALYVATVRDTIPHNNMQEEDGIQAEDRGPAGLGIGLVVDEGGKDVEEGRGLLQSHESDGEASQ
jgi:drug/metabolite transporter (DMT)-like permease